MATSEGCTMFYHRVRLLVGSSREGKLCGSLHTGLHQFRRPQTTSMHDIDDLECHMPSKTSFPAGIPFAKHVGEKWWYTTIRLGRDSQGRLVKEKAHRLIAAARYGVPDTLFQVGLSKSQVHQALHLPKDPHHKGGCNNPLHMRWGLPAENRLDQSLRRARTCRDRVGRPKAEVDVAPTKGSPVTRRVTRSQARAN